MNKYLKTAYQPYKWLMVIPFTFFITMVAGLICILTSLFFSSDATNKVAVAWARLCCIIVPFRVRISGKENFSGNRSYVVVANHQSMADIPVIHGFMGLNIKWVMKKELKSIPVFGSACHRLGCIFVDRSDSRAAIQSIHEAEKNLSENASVFFFAEGTRSRNGQLLPFKKGAFIFAMETGIPILPVTIKNSFQRLPSKSLDLEPGTVEVIVHPPARLTGAHRDRLDQEIEDIRKLIAQDL